MTTTVLAVYENGVFHPAGPISLKEGEIVQLTVTPPAAPLSREEAIQRIKAAKTLDELFAAVQLMPDETPEGYDFYEAMNENRKGERIPYPPEQKGISW